MISARIAVRYEDDWTARSSAHDVYGEFLAYTFENNRYLALVVLSSTALDATLDLIRDHETITAVRVIDRTESTDGPRGTATLFVRSRYREIPPMEMLTYEGFFPSGNPSIEDGRIRFDLLLEDREALDHALATLEGFGPATVEYLSEAFRYHETPTAEEFERLLDAVSPRQLEILTLAVAEGYFEDRRSVTVEELADELGIAKTTASRHLRRGRLRILRFLARHLGAGTESGERRPGTD